MLRDMTGQIAIQKSRSCPADFSSDDIDRASIDNQPRTPPVSNGTSSRRKKNSNDATTVVAEAAFSDPRKFGFVEFATSTIRFDELAPDALLLEDVNDVSTDILPKLVEQSTCIKAILLDQKRVVSGVGNWIADEMLYHAKIHPEQNFLTKEEAQLLLEKMDYILKTSIAQMFFNTNIFKCEVLKA